MDIFNLKFGNQVIKATFNKFAKQADGAVMLECEKTQILITVVASKKKVNNSFFPLTINYEEKLYALGKIPGNYQRREGRPSEEATLAARLIDRPIRPMFPDGYNNEIQIVCTIMSLDHKILPEILSINGSSLALLISENIPFEEAIGAVHIGYIDNEFIINPSLEERKVSQLNLKMSGTSTEINMVEAEANELSEDVIIDALLFGHQEIKKIVKQQQEIVSKLDIKKEVYIKEKNVEFIEYKKFISENYTKNIKNSLMIVDKLDRNIALNDTLEACIEQLTKENLVDEITEINKAYEEVKKEIFRKLIIEEKYRVDGRKIDELRKLTSEVDILKSAHGSAMFTRGQTQVLSVITLGMKSDAQIFDGLEEKTLETFLLHYNFPPYSVGETGRIGAPGRREMGHGHLAHMAIAKVLPSFEEFPYIIKATNDVLESNGSSSQATICATSLALMQAGVPIKKQVAGIAMGLISEGEKYTILTDIQGLEDHLGDMDFKVAGTRDGICTIQMDIKVKGISKEILTESLAAAKIARMQILDNMDKIICKPNIELSKNAPKTTSFKIKENQIKLVIGRGGEMINKIISETNVKIDIEEDGQVFIYSKDQIMINKAKEMILVLTKEFIVGEEYFAKVVRIEKFGCFVNINIYDKEALLHISDLSTERIEKVEDVINLNDCIKVVIKEVDDKNRIKVKLIKE